MIPIPEQIKGYVTVRISGTFPERFINLCIKHNIHLRKLSRKGDVFYANVSRRGFRGMRPLARKTGVRIRIDQKQGLSFKIQKYRKRYFFIPGILLFCFLVGMMSSIVWRVDIEGCERLEEREVRALLKDAGLFGGTLKSKVNPKEIQRKVLLQTDDIVWLWPDIRGVRAKVKIKESTPKPQMVPSHMPVNIVATEDGVITSLMVEEGEPVCAEGDTVTKGDLLISGIMTNRAVGAREVHALGKVEARTWVEKSAERSLKKEIREPSGRKKTAYFIKFFNFSINLFGNSGNVYANCDKIIHIKDGSFLGIPLPIRIFRMEYREMNVSYVPEEKEKIVRQTEEVLRREAAPLLSGGTLLHEETAVQDLEDGQILITLRMEVLKNIAEERPLWEEETRDDGADGN